MKDRPTNTLLELKNEILKDILIDIPIKHPKSKFNPNKKCKTCLGTGWKLIYKNKFLELEGKYSYKDCYAFFCECTYFSKENVEIINKMFTKLR